MKWEYNTSDIHKNHPNCTWVSEKVLTNSLTSLNQTKTMKSKNKIICHKIWDKKKSFYVIANDKCLDAVVRSLSCNRNNGFCHEFFALSYDIKFKMRKFKTRYNLCDIKLLFINAWCVCVKGFSFVSYHWWSFKCAWYKYYVIKIQIAIILFVLYHESGAAQKVIVNEIKRKE